MVPPPPQPALTEEERPALLEWPDTPGCELSTSEPHANSLDGAVLRLAPDGPGVVSAAGAQVKLWLPKDTDTTFAFVRFQRDGVTLNGYLPQSEVTLHPGGPDVIQRWIQPRANAKLYWTGTIDKTHYRLEYRPKHTHWEGPLRTELGCDRLRVAKDSFGGEDAGFTERPIAKARVAPGTRLEFRTERNTAPVGAVTVQAPLSLFKPKRPPMVPVDVYKRKAGFSLIVLERSNDFVYGWVESKQLRPRTGKAKDDLANAKLLGLLGERLESDVRRLKVCNERLPLVLQSGSELRTVGELGPKVPMEAKATSGKLTEIQLPTLNWLELKKAARLLVFSDDVTGCETKEVDLTPRGFGLGSGRIGGPAPRNRFPKK